MVSREEQGFYVLPVEMSQLWQQQYLLVTLWICHLVWTVRDNSHVTYNKNWMGDLLLCYMYGGRNRTLLPIHLPLQKEYVKWTHNKQQAEGWIIQLLCVMSTFTVLLSRWGGSSAVFLPPHACHHNRSPIQLKLSAMQLWLLPLVGQRQETKSSQSQPFYTSPLPELRCVHVFTMSIKVIFLPTCHPFVLNSIHKDFLSSPCWYCHPQAIPLLFPIEQLAPIEEEAFHSNKFFQPFRH